MKRQIIVLTASFWLIGSFVFGQSGFRLGPRFGIGASEFKKTEFEDAEIQDKLAVSGGIGTEYFFRDFVGLGADVVLLNQGSRVHDSRQVSGAFGSRDENFTDTYNALYVEIPLTLRLSAGTDQFRVYGYWGPAYQVLLNGRVSREYEDPNVDDSEGFDNQTIDELETLVTSHVFGIGLSAKAANNETYFIELRSGRQVENMGDLNRNRVGDNRLGYVNISVGVKF